MKVEIKIDETENGTRVLIITDKMSDDVYTLAKRISDDKPEYLIGYKDETAEILNNEDIYSVCSANKKVYAITENGEYAMRFRMYELEEKLDSRLFVRISNSEIINIKKVSGFDLKLSGTICVKLKNGRVTYVSRRYVTKIKETLGLWGVYYVKKYY